MDKKERRVGTVSRGIRCPIIREGDDLSVIVTDSVLEAAESEGFELRDRDVIAVTESIVARAQGNYAGVDDIAEDVRTKLGGETIGVIFPILSRNRFAICLRGIAKGAKKVVLMLSYPSDEVGNALVTQDQIDESGVNPYSDVLSLEKYRELFGYNVHEFTGVDYVDYYEKLIRECGAEPEIIFANQAKAILNYADCILNCDIHTRKRTKRVLLATSPRRTGSSCSRGTRSRWSTAFRRRSLRRPGRRSKSWSTATAPSRIPRERSGSWRTRWSPRSTPTA